MPARNNRLARRAAPALFALWLAIAPAAAQIQNHCGAIAALTNIDGRHFADLSLRITGPDHRLSLSDVDGVVLPPPDECELSTGRRSMDLSCRWLGHADRTAAVAYAQVLAPLMHCAAGTPIPTLSSDYGGATALRRERWTIDTPGGTTGIDLVLIRPAAGEWDEDYVTLSITYEDDD